jgi:hypothetical protein
MTSALVWIGLVGLFAWLWLDGARARELATGIAESMCRRRGLQFLDGTVSLQRIGLRRGPHGMQIRRLFGFDFSIEGVGRHSGYLILLGNAVERFDLGLPDNNQRPEDSSSTQEQPPKAQNGGNPGVHLGGNVVPFRRPPKR